jgi:hypothetical protein
MALYWNALISRAKGAITHKGIGLSWKYRIPMGFVFVFLILMDHISSGTYCDTLENVLEIML